MSRGIGIASGRFVGRALGAVAFLGVAVALSGCSSSGPPPAPASATPASVEAAHELVGTWTIDSRFDSPEQPFVTFLDDGTWSASDGCNRVKGHWEVAESGVLVTRTGPQTMMNCAGAQLPLAVSFARIFIVEGDSLTLHSADRSTTTDLIRTKNPRVGPGALPIGYWAENRTPESPFLSISTDRTYTGNDGCNLLTGTWDSGSDPGSVVLQPGATTLKACEGVDTWLNLAVRGTVDGDVMSMFGTGGAELGQLSGF
ncbi:META domain-containing protein [Glaciibacter sp. 2TAF33]|uniref:META domain-containing protein n=1 Tax=Glaciibacter sp. 2TAF33 TaxID=3233015 RepID=UPI003F901050